MNPLEAINDKMCSLQVRQRDASANIPLNLLQFYLSCNSQDIFPIKLFFSLHFVLFCGSRIKWQIFITLFVLVELSTRSRRTSKDIDESLDLSSLMYRITTLVRDFCYVIFITLSGLLQPTKYFVYA